MVVAGALSVTPDRPELLEWDRPEFSEPAPLLPAYVNRMGFTQLRLRFTKDDNNDLGADYLSFYSGNAAASVRPVLEVVYYVP